MALTLRIGMDKPKYKLGDKVWTISDTKAVERIVVGMMFNEKGRVKYDVKQHLRSDWSNSNYCHTDEESLFPTKEALIASL